MQALKLAHQIIKLTHFSKIKQNKVATFISQDLRQMFIGLSLGFGNRLLKDCFKTQFMFVNLHIVSKLLVKKTLQLHLAFWT
jgi:hypothetical protein